MDVLTTWHSGEHLEYVVVWSRPSNGCTPLKVSLVTELILPFNRIMVASCIKILVQVICKCIVCSVLHYPASEARLHLFTLGRYDWPGDY